MVGKVGVAIPFYATTENRRLEYFRNGTLPSLLNQDYDFRAVVVNDGSPDEEAVDFLSSIADPRVEVLHRERGVYDIATASNSLNMAFLHLFKKDCSALCYLHSDDMLTRGSLELRAELIRQGVDFTAGPRLTLKGEKLRLNSPRDKNELDYKFNNERFGFPHHSSMWSKELMELLFYVYGGFNPDHSCGEDWEFTDASFEVLKIAGGKIEFTDSPAYVWVASHDNITSQIKYIPKNRIYGRSLELMQQRNLRKHLKRPFFFLPEDIKKALQPLKRIVHNASFGLFYPLYREKDIEKQDNLFIENFVDL